MGKVHMVSGSYEDSMGGQINVNYPLCLTLEAFVSSVCHWEMTGDESEVTCKRCMRMIAPVRIEASSKRDQACNQ